MIGPFTAEALAAWSGASDSAPKCAKCHTRVDVPASVDPVTVRCGFACLPPPVFDHPDTSGLLPQWKRGLR